MIGERVKIQPADEVVFLVRRRRIKAITRRIQQIASVPRKVVRRRIARSQRLQHRLVKANPRRVKVSHLRRVDGALRARVQVRVVGNLLIAQKAIGRHRAHYLLRNGVATAVVVKEEEQLVLPDRPTHIATELVTNQGSARHTFKVVEPLVRLQRRVAVVLINVAVEVVGARARHHLKLAAAAVAVARQKSSRGTAELLHRIDRRIAHHRARVVGCRPVHQRRTLPDRRARRVVRDIQAVQRNAVLIRTRARSRPLLRHPGLLRQQRRR